MYNVIRRPTNILVKPGDCPWQLQWSSSWLFLFFFCYHIDLRGSEQNESRVTKLLWRQRQDACAVVQHFYCSSCAWSVTGCQRGGRHNDWTHLDVDVRRYVVWSVFSRHYSPYSVPVGRHHRSLSRLLHGRLDHPRDVQSETGLLITDGKFPHEHINASDCIVCWCGRQTSLVTPAKTEMLMLQFVYIS